MLRPLTRRGLGHGSTSLPLQIWILSYHRFTARRGDEMMIRCQENQWWQAMGKQRLIDDTSGSQLDRVVSPQGMTLDKFSGKVNDAWLSRDDTILRGTVDSEALDQLISRSA